MADYITLLNCSGTNWCNPEWAAAKKAEMLKDQVMWIEHFYTGWTNKQKAKRAGMSLPYYTELKSRFGLTKKRRKKK